MAKTQELIRLLITIVDRGQGEVIFEVCNKYHIHLNFTCFGNGTANSDILNLLGLGSSEKDVVLTMVPDSKIPGLLTSISRRMNLRSPGRGIAFTLPLSGINALIAKMLTKREKDEPKQEERKVDNTVKFSVIIAVYNSGFSDFVFETAKNAGATGGTILHARGLSDEEGEKFFGMSIQAEKEIIAILSPEDIKKNIMEAINKNCGLKTESQAIVFSLPVQDMIGL
ncbi:hypothetical protein [Youxingia wuxianensis]|uniref:Nitrogen regulatory protein P-II n=1 Tax=Youxingia wuxianensis TaxID=2763678 RepID=A0A926ETN9_9FIRM|nr:hypothetical protein [Youxingia wuxianensis]MBC8586090.1 hypothetical protein [Youxingia wuxianensis]